MLSSSIRNCFGISFRFFLTFVVLLCAEIISAQNVREVFKFIHSFRAPQLAQRDGTIAFWRLGGDAKADYHQLRLAPSLHFNKGWAWNVKPFVSFFFCFYCIVIVLIFIFLKKIL